MTLDEQRIATLEAFRRRVQERVAFDNAKADDDLLIARINDLDNVNEAAALMRRAKIAEAELQRIKDLLDAAEETWRGFRILRLVAENKRLTAKVWAHEEWLKRDSQYDENLRLKAEVKRLREAVEPIYARLVKPNTVGSSTQWVMVQASELDVLLAALAAQAPAECHHHRITPECQECKLAREKV